MRAARPTTTAAPHRASREDRALNAPMALLAVLLFAAVAVHGAPTPSSSRRLQEALPPNPPALPYPPSEPPASPPPPPSANTTISFFNVGACATVAAVKFDFADPDHLCPEMFRTLTGHRCHVPGPYGVEVFVAFGGNIEQLVITLLDPAADDTNLTTPILVEVAPIQKRNHIGAVLKPGTPAGSCYYGFEIVNEAAPAIPPIGGGYFRTIFRHAAVDAGDALVRSNGDSTLTTLSPGGRYALDQLLVAPSDMPTPVTISYTGLAPPYAALASSVAQVNEATGQTRLWGSTCEMATTGFVLYGRPAAGLPLKVLRLDGAGDEECSYPDTYKFSAEVAFYNTVASPTSFQFAFGLSPFLPYGQLQTTSALAVQQSTVQLSSQPGEIYVKVIDTATSAVVVLSQRVPIHSQRRNLIGVSLTASGGFKLDLPEAENATHTTADVAPSHFRLIFAHAALTLSAALVRVNDDIDLVTVAPGGHAYLDHPRIPPHQAGKILKLTFQIAGQPDYSTLIDLSVLCDGAAYGIVLVGTADQLDTYDPLLVQVGGTATTCTLASTSIHLASSASLAMANLAPSLNNSVRFEFGSTLLSLNRMSVPLPFRGSSVTDVGAGDLFVRLLKPDPPYQPLTSIFMVTVHPQSRNALVARKLGTTGTFNSDGIEQLQWGILDVGTSSSMIGATQTRVVLVNMLEEPTSTTGGSTSSSSSTPTVATAAVSAASYYGPTSITLPASSPMGDFEIHHDLGAQVTFRDQYNQVLGAPAAIQHGEACAQSVQLIALGGIRGRTDDLAPGPMVVDGADGYCRLIIPLIPPAEAIEQATTQPPATTSTLDIFGDGGPGDGGIFPSDSPAPRSGRACVSLRPMTFALLVLLGSLAAVRF